MIDHKEALRQHYTSFDGFYSHYFSPHKTLANGEWQVRCPFHDDNTPSMTVNTKTGMFNCFGCNAQGDFIKTISAGTMDVGDHSVAWDGTDSEGRTVSDGYYQFEVLAGDAEGRSVATETFIVGVVTGVTFDDNGIAHLLVNDMSIPMNSIVHVAETESIAGTQSITDTEASLLTFFTKNWR